MIRNLVIFTLLLLCFSCGGKKEKLISIETSLGTIRVKLYNETPLHRNNFIKLVNEGYYDGMLFHRVIADFMIQAGDPDSKDARPGVRLGAKEGGQPVKAEICPQIFHKRGVIAAAREGDNVNPERNSSGSHFYIVQGRVFSPEELDSIVEKTNSNRYAALFERLKQQREPEIIKYQLANNYDALMRINGELSEQTKQLFDKEKLVLTDGQKKIYTTIGGVPHLDGAYTVFGEVVEGMEVVDKIAALEGDENFRPLQDAVIYKMKFE